MKKLEKVEDSIVSININQSYPIIKNANELYDYTRGVWRLSKDRASKAEYAFAVYKGQVMEVYEIKGWFPAESTAYLSSRKIDSNYKKPRFEFVGKVASDEIRDKYLGKMLPEMHSQNPICYYNC